MQEYFLHPALIVWLTGWQIARILSSLCINRAKCKNNFFTSTLTNSTRHCNITVTIWKCLQSNIWVHHPVPCYVLVFPLSSDIPPYVELVNTTIQLHLIKQLPWNHFFSVFQTSCRIRKMNTLSFWPIFALFHQRKTRVSTTIWNLSSVSHFHQIHSLSTPLSSPSPSSFSHPSTKTIFIHASISNLPTTVFIRDN